MTLKRFVLDTNVLLHDPSALLGFKNHTIVTPQAVLEELDNIKSQERNVSADARQVIRLLRKLIGDETDLSKKGVQRNEEGGRLIIPLAGMGDDETILSNFAKGSNDQRIIREALILQKSDEIQKSEPGFVNQNEQKYSETIFVTKDINAQVIARAAGLKAEDYRAAQIVDDQNDISTGIVCPNEADVWALNPTCDADAVYKFNTHELEDVLNCEVYPNQVIQLCEEKYFIVELIEDGHCYLKHLLKDDAPDAYSVEPKNIAQAAALELLFDDNVPCVVLTGEAGSGKTFLSLATALDETDRGKYNRTIVSRTTTDLDADIGFLPGTEEEKMSPWLESIADNIEALIGDTDGKEIMDSAVALCQRKIQYKSLNFMRGRSIQNSIFILDEGQNLTPHQIKTMITRIGQGSKLVILGDLSQIDNPYLSAYSSGLTYVIERMKESYAVAHVHLNGSERSFLAQEANRLL